MLGCDLHCGYCQNWVSSQALRDISFDPGFSGRDARELVDLALLRGAASLVSTYNEASDHRRVGRGGLPRGQGRGPGDRLRLQLATPRRRCWNTSARG